MWKKCGPIAIWVLDKTQGLDSENNILLLVTKEEAVEEFRLVIWDEATSPPNTKYVQRNRHSAAFIWCGSLIIALDLVKETRLIVNCKLLNA